VSYTFTPTHTHICTHAQNRKLAGTYTLLCKNPTMKLQSNCDKRYTRTPTATATPTATHVCMHAHRDQTGLDATSTQADPETQIAGVKASSEASMQ